MTSIISILSPVQACLDMFYIILTISVAIATAIFTRLHINDVLIQRIATCSNTNFHLANMKFGYFGFKISEDIRMDRHIDKQADRYTDKQTDRQTEDKYTVASCVNTCRGLTAQYSLTMIKT